MNRRKPEPRVTSGEFKMARAAWRTLYEGAPKMYARDTMEGDVVIFKSEEEIDSLDAIEEVYYFPVMVTAITATNGVRVVTLGNELTTEPYAFYLKRTENVVRLKTEVA